jgi:hypothetical protein
MAAHSSSLRVSFGLLSLIEPIAVVDLMHSVITIPPTVLSIVTIPISMAEIGAVSSLGMDFDENAVASPNTVIPSISIGICCGWK